MLGGDVHTVKGNTEAMLVSSKENGLEMSAEKSKYVYGHVWRSECRTILQHKVR